MAKTYHFGRARRLVNAVMARLARVGLAGSHTYPLTVRGRNTGNSYSSPVVLIEDGDCGSSLPTVTSARSAPLAPPTKCKLTRAGRSERLEIEEVGAAQAAPILQAYLKRVPVVRPCFDVSPDSPLAEIEAESPHHPVVRLTDTSAAPIAPRR